LWLIVVSKPSLALAAGELVAYYVSKVVIMGVELPFPSELGGSNRSRDDMYAPEGRRHGSGQSLGRGLHDEAFLLQLDGLIFVNFWRCSVCYFVAAEAQAGVEAGAWVEVGALC